MAQPFETQEFTPRKRQIPEEALHFSIQLLICFDNAW
jgi:hypothetical protein